MDGRYYSPDQIGERAFCIWEITIFPDDYAYLGVILDNNEQAVIIDNYPAELAGKVEELSNRLPVHKAKFENGLIVSNPAVPAFDCSCWLKGGSLVPFQEVL